MNDLSNNIKKFNKDFELSSGYDYNQILKNQNLNFFKMNNAKEIEESIYNCILFIKYISKDEFDYDEKDDSYIALSNLINYSFHVTINSCSVIIKISGFPQQSDIELILHYEKIKGSDIRELSLSESSVHEINNTDIENEELNLILFITFYLLYSRKNNMNKKDIELKYNYEQILKLF